MPEDSARHVDWKATAKSGSLKVREFAREDERRLCIVFDNPQPGMLSEQAYENAVDLTASLAWHFSEQETEVSFLAAGHPRTRDLHEFLAWLAVIEPAPATAGSPDSAGPSSAGDVLHDIQVGPADAYHVIVTARSRDSLQGSLLQSSYFVFAGGNTEPSPPNPR